MLKNRQPRKNYRRRARAGKSFRLFGCLRFCLTVVAGFGLLVATSLLFVLAYEVLTQCDYFKAASLTIEGARRLTREEIIAQAGVRPGMNILAVNLALTRKRLLVHPWIADAEVSREIPAALKIKIREQTPLAIVDLGHKFLINTQGELFKEWTASDPDNLPLVSGLEMSDLTAYAKNDLSGPGIGVGRSSKNEQQHPGPLDAVMLVLRLGEDAGSVLPNRLIKKIRVDREIGLTLLAFSQVRTIHLGYNRYADKYDMLKSIISYLNGKKGFPGVDRIDLNNLNRIVVTPAGVKDPAGDDKEV